MNSTSPDEFRLGADRRPVEPAPLSDEVLYWPIIFAVGWPVLFVSLCFGPPLFVLLLAPSVLFLWTVSVVAAIYFAVARAYDRKWRRFWSIMAMPLTALVVGLSVYITVGLLQ
jgi:hypothetical protein